MLSGTVTGAARFAASKLLGHNAAKTYERTWPEVLTDSVTGALAEMAYCKAAGIYWPASVCNYKGPDAGQHTQIRSTHHQGGHLFVYEDDKLADCFVLVTGTPPALTVHGWITGEQARQVGKHEQPEGHKRARWKVRQDQLTQAYAPDLPAWWAAQGGA